MILSWDVFRFQLHKRRFMRAASGCPMTACRLSRPPSADQICTYKIVVGCLPISTSQTPMAVCGLRPPPMSVCGLRPPPMSVCGLRPPPMSVCGLRPPQSADQICTNNIVVGCLPISTSRTPMSVCGLRPPRSAKDKISPPSAEFSSFAVDKTSVIMYNIH